MYCLHNLAPSWAFMLDWPPSLGLRRNRVNSWRTGKRSKDVLVHSENGLRIARLDEARELANLLVTPEHGNELSAIGQALNHVDILVGTPVVDTKSGQEQRVKG